MKLKTFLENEYNHVLSCFSTLSQLNVDLILLGISRVVSRIPVCYLKKSTLRIIFDTLKSAPVMYMLCDTFA